MPIELQHIINILKAPVNSQKPWMTARGLAARLGDSVNAKDVEKCLLKYLDACLDLGEKPEVRYSSLPSRNSLEVLWGHTRYVGQRTFSGIHKNNLADDSLGKVSDMGTVDVFISHSFRDYDKVMAIAKDLQQAGLHPWLAETHIDKGDHINEQVIWGIQDSACFMLFLSSNALQSKWTGKEFQQAFAKNIKIILIADCSDPFIKQTVGKMLSGQKIDSQVFGSAAYGLFESLFIGHLPADLAVVIYPDEDWQDLSCLANSQTAIYPLSKLTELINNQYAKTKKA